MRYSVEVIIIDYWSQWVHIELIVFFTTWRSCGLAAVFWVVVFETTNVTLWMKNQRFNWLDGKV